MTPVNLAENLREDWTLEISYMVEFNFLINASLKSPSTRIKRLARCKYGMCVCAHACV